MKRINKTQVPAFFSDCINRNNLQKWEDIPPATRNELRQHILNEQSHCCAYTEIRLPSHNKNCHIDHFKTRNLHPELTFEYPNLLVACNCENYGAKYKDKQIKKKEEYAEIINPVTENPTEHIEFTLTGNITAREGSQKGEQTIRYFNLNERKLVEIRKRQISIMRSMNELSEDELVQLVGEFETMIRQLYDFLQKTP